MSKRNFSLLLFVFAVDLLFAADPILFGALSTGVDKADDYFLEHSTFVISYDSIDKIPNWVGWHLEKKDMSKGRANVKFEQDPLLPSYYEQGKHEDYTNSGYDRGHLCPNADRNAYNLGKETFVMTNVAPQLAQVNRGPWKDFEAFVQEKCNNGYEAYIYAGCLGYSTEIPPKDLEKSAIVVPQTFWKVVLLLRDNNSDSDLGRVKEGEIFCILIPNDTSVQQKDDWEKYQVPKNVVEIDTGYSFFEE